jgi:hypothetical protein
MKLLRDAQIKFLDGRKGEWNALRADTGSVLPVQRINERSLGHGYRRAALETRGRQRR